MNRNVLFGGVAAVVVLLGTAGYLIFSGRNSITGTGPAGSETQGPATLNQVTVISEHTTNLSQDGKRLSIGFPAFELKANAGVTTSTVFSTTWHVKPGADERVVVATSTLNGFMKSTGVPSVPAAAPTAPATSDAATPATAPAAETPATPPAEAAPAADGTSAAPATQPAAPVVTGPVAGDGTARVIVAIGSEASVTEWRDHSGAGADRKLSKAVSYVGATNDLRDGGPIPVTVTIEVSGGTSMETLAKLNSIDLQIFTESAPLPVPAADTATTATPAATPADASTPADAATPAPATPAPDATAPATPPAGTNP